jgi:nitrate reductase (NAD(P)H)
MTSEILLLKRFQHFVLLQRYMRKNLARNCQIPLFDYCPPRAEDNSEASDESSTPSRRSSETLLQTRYPLPPPTKPPKEALKENIKTPDNHVPRDPRLIRLTGVYPINVEASLSALYNEGFLTSPELFYVRNHGVVPEVNDAIIPGCKFFIGGMIKTPIIMTLRQLIANYEQITVHIALVCTGNRREEQIQVRKSKDFSWGAAGVSTALWTDVLLMELLRMAVPTSGAKNVCMEGADKLPNGYYGTSVKLNWMMDPNRARYFVLTMESHYDVSSPVRSGAVALNG